MLLSNSCILLFLLFIQNQAKVKGKRVETRDIFLNNKKIAFVDIFLEYNREREREEFQLIFFLQLFRYYQLNLYNKFS